MCVWCHLRDGGGRNRLGERDVPATDYVDDARLTVRSPTVRDDGLPPRLRDRTGAVEAIGAVADPATRVAPLSSLVEYDSDLDERFQWRAEWE